MYFRQTVLILFILIALSNCAVMEPIQPPPESEIGEYPPSTRPTYNLSGYPTAMKDGYIDGCETAKDTPYGKKMKIVMTLMDNTEWAGMMVLICVRRRQQISPI